MSKAKPRLSVECADILKGVTMDHFQDDNGRKLFPTLHDLLSPRWKDTVMTRQGARLTVRVDAGNLRVTIDCPTEGLVSSFMIESLDELLPTLERVLANGQAKWGLSYGRAKKNLPTIDKALQ